MNSPAPLQPPIAPSEDESEFVSSKPSSLGVDKIDDIDTTEYPDTGLTRNKLDAEEGSMIGRDVSKYAKEPEGIRASLYTSLCASDAASVVARDEDKSQNTPKSRERADPPSKAFPDDEIDAIFEKYPCREMSCKTQMEPNESAGNVNFIVDDGEDSFINESEYKENKSVNEEYENEEKDTANDSQMNDRNENLKAEEVYADNTTTILNEPVINTTSADEREHFMISFHDNLNRDVNTPSSETSNLDHIKASIETASRDGAATNVTKPTPQSQAPQPDRFYFDIHKDAYKEIHAKLAEHSYIVAYVEKWEQIVTNRVQSAYTYYCKDRVSLNHYARKLDLLIEEDLRNKEKNRPIKGKQIDKLERNRDKFDSALETHDNAGESLLMLIEEVTLRSWRDAFPLLRKSIQFESDVSAINQKHMVHLGRSLDMLDIIGQKESIAMEGRLEDLEKLDPEKIFTGAKAESFEEEEEFD